MAHIKYRYFAKLARAAGDEATARVFEETAAQEVQHAFGHLDLLYPKAKLSPARALEIAIAESKQHAQSFRRTLEQAAKRFAALAKVEQRHANQYQAALVQAQR